MAIICSGSSSWTRESHRAGFGGVQRAWNCDEGVVEDEGFYSWLVGGDVGVVGMVAVR